MASRKTVVGLDIGQHSVKAAWVRRKGQGAEIVRAEKLRLPRGASDIRSILEPWIEKTGLARHSCVLGISGAQCMFQPFILPPGDPRTPEQVASMEIIRFNEMASEQMIYGHADMEMNPGERLLLLGMARPPVLEQRLQSVQAMNLDAIDMIPSPVALFNALEPGGSHTSPTLCVSIGQDASDVAIGTPKGILFARSFPYGGQAFTDELAAARSLSQGKAEDLKTNQGSLAPDNELAAPLAAAAEHWLEELQSCLSVYESVFSGRPCRPGHLMLAGGGAALPGLADFLSEKMGLTHSAAPALPAKAEIPEPPHAFATAYGLAVTGLGGARAALSLLPPDIKDDMVFRRQKPYWVATGMAASLIVAVGLVGGLRDTQRKQTFLAKQQASLRQREQVAAHIERIREERQRIRVMAEPVEKFARAAPQMRDLMTLAANSLDADDQIVMVSDIESFFAESLQPKSASDIRSRDERRRRDDDDVAKAIPNTTFERVVIEGYTRTLNLATVRELIARLRQAEFVKSADLISDDDLERGQRAQVVDPPGDARHFVIEVELTPL